MAAICIGAGSWAAAAAEELAAREWTKGEEPALPYRWHQPATLEAGRKYPLVLFLHGAGERGSDNQAQLKHGVRAILRWAQAESQPCFLLAPQCPPDLWWCDIDRTTWRPAAAGNPNPVMRRVIALLDDTLATQPVDPARVYLTGISMGGYGSWWLLGHAPEKIAAAVPVCGGGDPATAPRFKDVPLWVFHGDADPVVPPRTSREMVAALKKAGGKPQLTEYPGVGHDSWTATYDNPEVLRWLFAQRKPAGATPAEAK
jgi:predicted peptidase